MPNLIVGLCAVMLFTGAACPVSTVTCDAGYYLHNGECKVCNPSFEAFYCPGDNNRHACPTTDTDYNQFGYTLFDGGEAGWAVSPASSSYDCRASMYFHDAHGNKFLFEQAWNGTNYWYNGRFLWYEAAPGYYLVDYHNTTYKDWYDGVQACSNLVENATYTGAGTPEVGNCPWACNNGYARTSNNQCAQLCTAGVTQLKVGGMSIPLYASRQTTPALNIGYRGSVCYGSLVSGASAGAINIDYGGATYHVTR